MKCNIQQMYCALTFLNFSTRSVWNINKIPPRSSRKRIRITNKINKDPNPDPLRLTRPS